MAVTHVNQDLLVLLQWYLTFNVLYLVVLFFGDGIKPVSYSSNGILYLSYIDRIPDNFNDLSAGSVLLK